MYLTGCQCSLQVVFTLYLSRRSTFYLMNIILPCSLLSILILLVFCVPPDAGEKISIGISVLLAFTVFLLMLAESVPRTSLDVPILGIIIHILCYICCDSCDSTEGKRWCTAENQLPQQLSVMPAAYWSYLPTWPSVQNALSVTWRLRFFTSVNDTRRDTNC